MQHPGVEIPSRDRSKTYKSAMDKGAPAATQVADRFHLVQNLEETLEKVLSSYGNELKTMGICHTGREGWGNILSYQQQQPSCSKSRRANVSTAD